MDISNTGLSSWDLRCKSLHLLLWPVAFLVLRDTLLQGLKIGVKCSNVLRNMFGKDIGLKVTHFIRYF